MTDYLFPFENYEVITPAVTTPVTLANVKEHLKEYGTDNDAYITRLINVATDLGERITGRDFINKEYRAYLDYFPYRGLLEIRKTKLQSIVNIQYYINNTLTLWDVSNYYNTNTSYYSEIDTVDNNVYPSTDCRKQAVQIQFIAGYGDSADDVPDTIKQGLYMIIANLYENRGDCNECTKDLANEVLGSYILPNKYLYF